MNLKVKFAFWFAVFVTLVLSVTFAVIYLQSADFRRADFYNRLRQKALTTQQFLLEVEEIDSVLLRIIDRNTFITLPEEQILVFDGHNQLLYSNPDEDSIEFHLALLDEVRTHRELRRQDPVTEHELLGLRVDKPDGTYVVLASALDRYGIRKIVNLRNILLFTWLLGLGIAVLLAYLYVRNIVGKPLSDLTERISAIGGDNLAARLEVPKNQAELTILAQNFNELLERVERAFDAQRSFVQFASHELRTPLANMLSETENTLAKSRSPEEYQAALRSLREEQSRLIQMSNALLLLSHYEQAELGRQIPLVRVDEVLYQTIEEVRAVTPDARILLDFASVPDDQNELLAQGNSALLRTAFRNLIENACRYADDHTVRIQIQPARPDRLVIQFDNRGQTLTEAEGRHLFTPFFRGQNTGGQRGFGLGLVIAQRILRLHRASIQYQCPKERLNRFVVAFPRPVAGG